VAPGLNEIAILGKITSGIRKVGPALDYDLIVVDCYATGHALSLLQAPKGMMEAIQIGPMGHHSREIENVLRNPKLCGYIVVTLLEEMPVVETLDFCRSLKSELGVTCQVIANRVLNVPVGREDLLKIEAVDPTGMGEFAKYLVSIADRQSDFMQTLRSELNQITSVPLIFSNDPNTLVVQAGEALRKA
jgi:anion-transporting  ArsA/GET3 family ATPase